MHYYSTNLSSIFLVIFVPYFSTALGSVLIFWDTKRYRNLHVECNGAKCGLDPLGKMFQYIWLPRKKDVYWIIVMVYYSNYPRAVNLFCVHLRAPDGEKMTERDTIEIQTPTRAYSIWLSIWWTVIIAEAETESAGVTLCDNAVWIPGFWPCRSGFVKPAYTLHWILPK